MKVIKRALMPDGTEILLEDWSENNTPEYPNLHGYTIAAYPFAVRTGPYGWIKRGERFRLQISHNPYSGYVGERILSDFDALVAGEKSLADLRSHFYNAEKDVYLLGLETDWKPR